MKTPVLFLDWGAGFGGDTRVLVEMVDGLAGSAYQPRVVVRPGGAPERALAGCACRCIPIDLCEANETSRIDFVLRLAAAAISLVRVCRREKIRVVHLNRSLAGSHQVVALLLRLASFGKIRLVYHAHCAPKNNLLTKLTCRMASVIWAVSRFTASQYADWGIDADKIRHLANPFRKPERQAARVEWRRQLGIPETAPVLALVGRLSPNKGQHIAIEALAKLPAGRPVHLLIAGNDDQPDGNGDYRAQLGRLADRLRLTDRVHFLGHVERPADVFGAADLALVPSEEEAFGLSAIEAVACGTPVLASDRAGLREVVAETAGLPVCDRTPVAFAQAIRAHLDREVRHDIASAAVRLEAAYGLKAFRSSLLELLGELHSPHLGLGATSHGEHSDARTRC